MPEESVVVEKGDTQTDEDLHGFEWTDYTKYFPVQGKEFLTTLFSQQKYGWKSRARLLKRIDGAQIYVERLLEELASVATDERSPRTVKVINPREGLRAYLLSVSLETLQEMSFKYNVSYQSFMKDGDRTELVEALIDEMAS